MTGHILRWIAVLLWMGVVWVAGGKDLAADETRSVLAWLIGIVLPGWPETHPEGLRLLNAIVRKTAHMLAYGILWILWFRALPGKRKGLLAASLSVAWACLDEYRQTFLPERTGSALDIGIDAIGILAAQAAHRFRCGRPGRGAPQDRARPGASPE